MEYSGNAEPVKGLECGPFLETLVATKAESEVIEAVLDFLSASFSPALLIYLPFGGGGAPVVRGNDPDGKVLSALDLWMAQEREASFIPSGGASFYVRIVRSLSLYGAISVSGFPAPGDIGLYCAQAIGVARLCSLAIENFRLAKRIELLANTDALTGLPNRASFLEAASREIERARRYGSTVSAIMFDLDFFRAINEAYGHAAGDAVLRMISDHMGRRMRATDISGRLGGEEFAFMLPGTPVEKAFFFAERFRTEIAAVGMYWAGRTVNVTVSIGISQYPQSRENGENAGAEPALESLLSRCDQALSLAKKNGRNRCETYRA